MPAPVRAGDLTSVAQVEDHASVCRLCRLCRERTMVVTGSGPVDADVLVVAEAPGYHDDREGRLLEAAPGELFAEVLELAGITREDIFLTSVVKCRPPTGRAPFPDEVEACEGWLFREIALVQPRVVVTLGSLALRLVTGRQESIAEVHGELQHVAVQDRDIVVWPLYHPGAALHVDRLADALRVDARALGLLLAGARSERSTRERAREARTPTVPAAELPTPAAMPAPAPSTGATPHASDEPQLSFDVE
ncbi:MAG: phage polymerase-related protein [Thermoleophilia bacterium]|nr:phage polymerase-related protein [Thermoleophilia bacterium]